MGKYGETAVRATKRLQAGRGSAEDAWKEVAEEIFADAPEAMRKSCPRETFLGLCQEGLLVGVPMSTCRRVDSSRNRQYAIVAVRLLAADPDLADGSKAELWRRVLKEAGAEPNKRANEQMDVVLSLWANRLISASVRPLLAVDS